MFALPLHCFFSPLSPSSSTFLLIFQNTWNISSHYSVLFPFLTFSPVLTAVPLSTPKSRELLWPQWESLPNPLIEKREELNQARVAGWVCVWWGGAGAFTPHPHPPTHPPTHGRAESHPLTRFHPVAYFPILLPAVCSHFPGSYRVTVVPHDNWNHEVCSETVEIRVIQFACDSPAVLGCSQS